MKNFKKYLFAPVAIVFLAFSGFAQTAPQEIQNYVKRKGGKFPAEVNKYLTGDLNGDGKEDAVVQYYINEGAPGNYYSSYIAVFLNRGGKFVFAGQIDAGTKLSAGMIPQSVADGKIAVDTHAANSAQKTGTIYYKLSGKRLVKTR